MKYRLPKLHDEIRKKFNSLEDFAFALPKTTSQRIWDVITGKRKLRKKEHEDWARVLIGEPPSSEKWQSLISFKKRFPLRTKIDFSNKKWEPNPMVFDGSADLYLDDLKHI